MKKAPASAPFSFPRISSRLKIQLYASTMIAMPWPPPMQAVASP
jgi:hypothetical protein